jgi:hypothetical protein
MTNIIEKLPIEIQKKIYYDYLEIDVLYEEIMNIVEKSKLDDDYNLDTIVIKLKYILSKENLVNYFYDNDFDFSIAYNYHIKNKKHKFKLLPLLESFALHWIFWF